MPPDGRLRNPPATRPSPGWHPGPAPCDGPGRRQACRRGREHRVPCALGPTPRERGHGRPCPRRDPGARLPAQRPGTGDDHGSHPDAGAGPAGHRQPVLRPRRAGRRGPRPGPRPQPHPVQLGPAPGERAALHRHAALASGRWRPVHPRVHVRPPGARPADPLRHPVRAGGRGAAGPRQPGRVLRQRGRRLSGRAPPDRAGRPSPGVRGRARRAAHGAREGGGLPAGAGGGGRRARRGALWPLPTRRGPRDRPRAAPAGLRFDGLFAADDLLALGAMQALQESGRRVPQDVAVCGFDGMPGSELWTPALTTVAQRIHDLGSTAVRLLVDLVEGRIDEIPRVVLPVDLVIRDSTRGHAPEARA
ncbi:MAG: substrate-binding domain-containing protein [Chloroflexota bacterium]